MTELFPEGARVILRADSEWMSSESNPKEGSPYFCEGTLQRRDDENSLFIYAVEWDNGTYNHYKAGCLQEVSEEIPV